MKMSHFLLQFSVFLMVLTGCSEPSLSDKIVKDENSFFRGMNLGETSDKLIKEEGEPLKITDSLYEYEFVIPEKDSRDNKYNVSYKFHSKHGLVEITLETNLQKDEDVKATFNALKEHFRAKIGAPNEEEESYVYWEYDSDQFKGINVHLHDKSREWKYGRVFLRVFIWPLEE